MAFVVDVVLSWWIPESSEWQFSRAWEESRYLPTSTHDSTSRVFQLQGFQPEALIIGQSTGMCIISGQVVNWCKLTGWHIRRVHRLPLSRNTTIPGQRARWIPQSARSRVTVNRIRSRVVREGTGLNSRCTAMVAWNLWSCHVFTGSRHLPASDDRQFTENDARLCG